MSRHDVGALLLGFVLGWNGAIVMTLVVTSSWWDRRCERKAARRRAACPGNGSGTGREGAGQ